MTDRIQRPHTHQEDKLDILYVTWFWKTDLVGTFGILRNTDFKYSSHCSSLMLDCTHARYAI